MVSIVFLFLVFVLVLYAYQNHSREFEATASAIRQIWSGSCRVSCRSKYTSGPLQSGQTTADESDSCQTNQSTAGHSACVCETCPCALIENVLRTCRPATSVYNQSIEFISSGYYNIVKALCDAQKYVERLAECGVSCQRQVQLLSIQQVSSGDNINFINHTAVRAENNIDDAEPNQSKKGKGPRKAASAVQRKLHLGAEKEAESSQRSQPDTAISKKAPAAAVSQKADINVKQFEPAASGSESESSIGTMSDHTSCSRCIEKGKTCIGSCPRANGK